MATFNPIAQFGTPGSVNNKAITGFIGAFAAKPLVFPIEPWWGNHAWVMPGAKLETRFNLPIHKAGMSPWNGSWHFDERSNIWMVVRRGMWDKGSKINLLGGAAEFDPTNWSASPETIRISLVNNAPLSLAALLNGCYSGTPKDAAGNAVNHPGLAPCIDQIYGGSSGKIAVKEGDTANYKPVNPADPGLGSGWFNAYENFDITNPQSYIPVLEAFQDRRDMGNNPMGLGREGLELWVPTGKEERARLLHEVFRELAGSGITGPIKVDYLVDTGGTPATNQQVIYGSQQNPVFGRMRVKAIPGLRSDLAVMVSQRPAGYDYLSLFAYALGGNAGEYVVQDDPTADSVSNNVPHIAIYPWTQQSAMFFGVPGVSRAGDIGISFVLNEGFAWISGLCTQFLFSGSAS